MPRRIDVELTSERPDGTWTWRAAGAREPRGELAGSLLSSGTKVGDVIRAEAEFDIEGITVVAVLAQKEDDKPAFERLEVIGPERTFEPVTSTLTGRADRGESRDRGPRPGGDRGPRPGGDRGPRPGGDRGPRPGGERGPRPDRPDRPVEARDASRDRARSERPRRERPAPPPPLPERPKPKRLRAGRAHRDEFLSSLPPDRRLIAEQLLKGGVPAVRGALDEQNAKARAEGAPEVPTENILQVAEDLLPASRIADWLDKADAALTDVEELALNDLRAVVSSAGDVAREERTKELAATLRDALDRRTKVEQEQWVSDVKLSLEHGRVVRALRLASRPPEMNQALPDEVLAGLAKAAGAAMTAEIGPDRFGTLLDAVAYSPVRRDVEPAGVPAEPGDELLTTVKKHAGRAPTIAKLFGIEPPPAVSKQGRKARPAHAKPASGPIEKPKPSGPPVLIGGRKIPPPPHPVAKPLAPPTAVDAAPVEEPVVAEPVVVDAAPVEVPEEPPAPPTEIGEETADAAAADVADDVPAAEVPEHS